jgi:hypothetical protein
MAFAVLRTPRVVVDPVHESVRARAAELRLKLELVDSGLLLLGCGPDERGAADLARANDLEVIDEEDSHLRDVEEFLDLGLVGAVSAEAVVARLADAVGLVADEDVDLVALGLDVAVEVLELHLRAHADDSTDILGEGLRACCVLGVVAEFAELAHEVQGDDGLPGAGATPDEHHDLLLLVEALLRCARTELNTTSCSSRSTYSCWPAIMALV